MKMRFVLCMTLLFPGLQAQAADVDWNMREDCGMESGYSLKFRQQAILITTQDGDLLRLHNGQLLFNGESVPLSMDARQALQAYEQAWHEITPRALDLGIEALEAVEDVAEQLSTAFAELDAEAATQMRTRLQAQLQQLRNALEKQRQQDEVDEKALEKAIRDAVEDLLPSVMGDAIRLGLKLAFTHDEAKMQAFEQRMEALEPALKARFENPDAPFRQKVARLCEQFHTIDSLEADLPLTLPNGQRLDVVRFRAD